jgi:hypothetical protein
MFVLALTYAISGFAPLTPETALKVGLKVDVEALPKAIIAALRARDHYDRLFDLHLTDAQKADLVEYLKSL